jgi:hypothetical protein
MGSEKKWRKFNRLQFVKEWEFLYENLTMCATKLNEYTHQIWNLYLVYIFVFVWRQSPPDLFHGFHVGGGNWGVPLRFFNQNLTVDAITLTKYTHQISDFPTWSRSPRPTLWLWELGKRVGLGQPFYKPAFTWHWKPKAIYRNPWLASHHHVTNPLSLRIFLSVAIFICQPLFTFFKRWRL